MSQSITEGLKGLKARKESELEKYTTGGYRFAVQMSANSERLDVTDAHVQGLREEIASLGEEIELMEHLP
jgi:hypothetical protein